MSSSQITATNVPIVSISYRGSKLELVLEEHTTSLDVKGAIADSVTVAASRQQEPDSDDANSLRIRPDEIKLLWKGKVINDDNENLWKLFQTTGPKASKGKPIVYKVVAMGISSTQAEQFDSELSSGIRHKGKLVRDDLTEQGQQDLNRRARLGAKMLSKASSRSSGSGPSYGFGTIETIPNLPNEDQARNILQTLAKDPGILACMAKHQWNVGSLAELYPDGKVGQSPVCVMGLNKNKGQQILLRLRTDDIKGFRKILSIRKVLYHELAHNVHSEHDSDFFQLMRQIEKECNELDWTNGAGLSSIEASGSAQLYTAGTYRLGGGDGGIPVDHNHLQTTAPITSTDAQRRRELAARAAEMRMTLEEAQEIEENCGCSTFLSNNLFLPPGVDRTASSEGNGGELQQRNNNNHYQEGYSDRSCTKNAENNDVDENENDAKERMDIS